MEHGPVVHPEREIGRAAAAGVELDVDPCEHPVAVEAAAPVHAEVVALAGHHHVVVAVQPDLHRAAGDVRGEGGEAGPLCRLRLLAAERPAHPPAFAHHRRVGRAEHAGDEVLHLGGVLGRGVDPHLVVLAGHRERRLSLEIEMLLAADAHGSGETAGGGGDRGGRLPAPELVRGQHLAAPSEAIVHGDARRARLDLDAGASRGPAGRIAGGRDDREHHLSVKEDLACGEDRVVAEGRAAVVRAGNVRGGEDRDHPRRGAHRVEVHRPDRTARRRPGVPGGDVERAGRLWQVVDIGRGPLHMARGAVMGEGEADTRARAESRTIRERGVGDGRARFHSWNATRKL